VGTQTQQLQFVPQKEASQNLKDNTIPLQGAGNVDFNPVQDKNNLLPQFPPSAGNNNDFQQQNNFNRPVQDNYAPVNNNQAQEQNVPLNQNANLNNGLGTRDSYAQGQDSNNQLNAQNTNLNNGYQEQNSNKVDNFNGYQSNNNQLPAQGQSNQSNGFQDASITAVPSQNLPAADANAPAADNNIPGERPREGEYRMMGQQGAPAIIDQKPASSHTVGDQVPLDHQQNPAMAPRSGMEMQQAPPGGDLGGDLAPQGVQRGEGPQGQEQVRPPVHDDDHIEVRDPHDVDQNGYDTQNGDGDQMNQDNEADEDDERPGMETGQLQNEDEIQMGVQLAQRDQVGGLDRGAALRYAGKEGAGGNGPRQ